MKRRSALRWLLGLGLFVALAAFGSLWRLRNPVAPVCALTGDAARGQVWARTCSAACHDISPVEVDLKHSRGGPNLQNVYMALAGTTPQPWEPTAAYNHPYPPLAAARDAGVVWTDENLLRYLSNPKEFLDRATGKSFDAPLFYMQFFIGEESERRAVVAYLKTIKDHPECD